MHCLRNVHTVYGDIRFLVISVFKQGIPEYSDVIEILNHITFQGFLGAEVICK